MDRQQRIDQMKEAIAQRVAEGEGYIIFTDRQQPDNYVQLTSEGLIEVTSRNFRLSRLPRLTPEQIEQLAALGFSREARPNHQRALDLRDPAHVAELCEHLFTLLGSSPSFDLDIESAI